MAFWNILVAGLVSTALVASSALAHELQASATAQPVEASAAVPLYEDLGTLTYAITTNSQMAQGYFDQGLRLT